MWSVRWHRRIFKCGPYHYSIALGIIGVLFWNWIIGICDCGNYYARGVGEYDNINHLFFNPYGFIWNWSEAYRSYSKSSFVDLYYFSCWNIFMDTGIGVLLHSYFDSIRNRSI